MGSPNLSHMHTTYSLNSNDIQTHCRIAQHPVPSSTDPLPASLILPCCPLSCQWIMYTAKYIRVRLTNIKCFFVTYVM